MKKKKGFTLIELIAVLVIMAIIALIVTPLVLNIIRKVRISADKRSIDAYGRSIEYAIATYLLDTGNFPTDISQLTIEYSGDTVECETTQINPDSSIYLANCKVKNRSVDYTYGKDKSIIYDSYSVGDEVTYNGVDYYVLKDSSNKESTVTLLKSESLSVDEVNTYGGVGTGNNHVNVYVYDETEGDYYKRAFNSNGYGSMAYHSTLGCGRNFDNEYIGDDCSNNYNTSDVKYVVDEWAKNEIEKKYLKEARLMNSEEIENIPTETKQVCTGSCFEREVIKYDWVYNNSGLFGYYTMSPYMDSETDLMIVNGYVFTSITPGHYSYYIQTVRPVVELYKNDKITRKTS